MFELVDISLAFQGNLPIVDYIRYAKIMEQYDFDSFFVFDDICFYRSCWPILFAVAPHTKKLRIGPSATHPFLRHPASIANDIACLDELTQGRAVLGMCRGDASVYEQLATEVRRPLTCVKEAVEIVSRFIRGDMTAFNGDVFHVAEGLTFRYKTMRRAIPIFIGTWGPKLAQIAGSIKEVSEVRIDTLWNPSYIPKISEAIAHGAKEAGRDPSELRIAIGPQTSISKDREAARKYAKEILPEYLSYPPYSVMGTAIGINPEEIRAVTEAVLKKDYTREDKYTHAQYLISDRTIDNMAAVGTPEDIINGAKRMIRAGVTHISFCHPHGPNIEEAIHLIGREVIPHLKN